MVKTAVLPLVCALLASVAQAQTAPQPSAQRAAELVRMVRQDCGSCHGMRLTGGLGPALTREALVGKPPNYLSAVIFSRHCRHPHAPLERHAPRRRSPVDCRTTDARFS